MSTITKKSKDEVLFDEVNEQTRKFGVSLIGLRGVRFESYYTRTAIKGLEYALTSMEKIKKFTDNLKLNEEVMLKTKTKAGAIILKFKKVA